MSDGAKIVVSAFNTPQYDFEMVNLYGLTIAFGGWNKHDGLRGLKDFEIWSPTLQGWARGSDGALQKLLWAACDLFSKGLQ